MATTPEGRVKALIKKILKAHDVYYVMPVSNGMGQHGVPDFLCCVKGRFLAIEAKAGKGKTTALQDDHLRRINEAGGVQMVVNESNLDAVDTLLHLYKGTS